MNRYYINTIPEPDGTHLIHRADCAQVPAVACRRFLGEFGSCINALKEAERFFKTANGCRFCSNEVHRCGPRRQSAA